MTIQKRANAAIGLTILVAVLFLVLPMTPLAGVMKAIGFLFNALFAGLIGYFFLKDDFIQQFKHFKFKTLLYGIPLTILTGIVFGLLFHMIAGKPTTNSIDSSISLVFILTQIPFMLMGEELISTNLLIAFEKKGLSFAVSSVLVALLFAFWHVTAYGFHPLQLLLTLAPLRLVLNFLWKRSSSVWVSWICHFLYDMISLLPLAFK
ncbi:type II CAAX prenyl endopeptidase Rce1 family protein [uncultured Enterococcus sp.]|uniref:CPBP family glutamic-type intramembrane protease n=1 Tax=uncultured Enterococcus sp. TaxID=167972 RepID=UPI00258C3BF1|nr:CPBP family glutamic-type intramembrane protease [uncultured Enterococcus sp.]